MPFFGVPIRNGLPIGLGSVAGFGVQQFDPSELFVGGTAGAWYDPSDLSTMFTTDAGTTPVAMPGQGAAVPVGLMLDKSQGLVLGSELVTNGNFSSGTTGWSSFANLGTSSIAVVSGELQATTSVSQGVSGARQVLTGLTSGRWYKVVGTVRVINNQGVADVGATIRWANGNVTTGYSTLVSSTSTSPTQISGYFLAGNSTVTLFLVNGGSGTTPSSYVTGYDNISVRELPGNHAISFNNTTARPELRARVNLLTYSEEFDNGAWTKVALNAFGSGSVANTNLTTDPLGTNTADYIQEDTASGTGHGVAQSLTVSSGTVYTFSAYFKAAQRTIGVLRLGGTTNLNAFFNVSNGTVGTVSAGLTAAISSIGNGWYRCSVTWTSTVSGTQAWAVNMAATDGTLLYAGDGTSGIYIWGADLRPANIGANVPAYQRIADANTYDTSGFPLYLRFDGIDDSMYTPANLNLSGTDKVAVFAGVRKLSDAAIGTITELSANASTTNGTFQLRGPATNGAQNYYATVSGTSVAEYLPATFAAPITNVVSSIMDIAGASISTELIPRVNGVVEQDSPFGTAGTGNFGTHPLFIGSRNNGSFWFNGHLHSLIIAGSAVSAGNISATEQWVAGRTGIQI